MPELKPINDCDRRKKRGGLRRALTLTLFILCGYGLLAYLVLPGALDAL